MRLLSIFLLLVLSAATAYAEARFTMVDVVVDSGEQRLAAWQVEVKAEQGDVQIVGVEGGASRQVYRDPPYYDPAALSGGRIIVASYTTKDAPAGKVHVARLHLRVEGEWRVSAKPMAAADEKGKEIRVSASVAEVKKGERSEQ